MKFFETGIAGVMTVLMVSLLPLTGALAATTATVTATVTVQSISVTVGDGSIAYGALGANSSKSTIAADGNDTQTATNAGNVAEDLNIKGTNSTDWQLSANAGTDKYVHAFCTSSCGSPPTGFTSLSSQSYQTLATNVATSGTQVFDLRITTPNPSTVFTEQSVDVTVQAVAN